MKAIVIVLLTIVSSVAAADVFKCEEIDPHTGEKRITYTNDRRARGCTRLSTDLPVSSVPARASNPAASSAAPRVSDDQQKQRDDMRRNILNAELKDEEAALEAARKALAEQEAVRYGNERNYQNKLDRLKPFQDKVEQHERNIEALKKELANL